LGEEGFFTIMEILNEGKYLVSDMREHFLCWTMFPYRPPTLLMPREYRSEWDVIGSRPVPFLEIHVLEPFHEDEVGHLLDGLERV